MQDIHDIRPPVSIGTDPFVIKTIFIVIVLILMAAAVVWAVKKYLKNRFGKNRELLMLPEPLPPYEAALKELDRLLNLNLGEQRLIYFYLTAVLKKYIGRSYHFHGIQMTTPEFLKQINKIDVGKDILHSMSAFLKLSDQYKYAAVAPETDLFKQDY